MAYTQYWLLEESPNSEFHWKYIVPLLLTFYSKTHTHVPPATPSGSAPAQKQHITAFSLFKNETPHEND